MGLRKRATKSSRGDFEEGCSGKCKKTKQNGSRKAEKRRVQTDAQKKYREELRINNREAYRDSKNDLVQLASNRLLTKPRTMCIKVSGGKKPKYKNLQGYSVTMAAKALGKSIIQVRKWIDRGYIPKPILPVRNHTYRVYSYGELQVIRKHLYQYSKTGVSYITKNSLEFIEELNTSINNYRIKTYGK